MSLRAWLLEPGGLAPVALLRVSVKVVQKAQGPHKTILRETITHRGFVVHFELLVFLQAL